MTATTEVVISEKSIDEFFSVEFSAIEVSRMSVMRMVSPVIPGRASGANPGSITTEEHDVAWAASLSKRLVVMGPGPRCARPGQREVSLNPELRVAHNLAPFLD